MLRQLLVLHTKPAVFSHKSVFSLLQRISAGQLQLNHIVRHSSSERSRILTIPNALTSLRIACTPGIVYLIIQNHLAYAASITVIAGLTDIADGFIARRFPSQRSVLGSYIDPLADKIFVSLLSFALAYAGLMPMSLFLLFMSRDLLLMSGASYLRFISQRQPRQISRFFDPHVPVIEMKPINSSKLNTAAQITSIFASLAAPLFNFADSVGLSALWVFAAITTTFSGLGYARQMPFYYREAMKISKAEAVNSRPKGKPV